MRHKLGWQLHGVSGFRVTSGAGSPMMQGKTAKSTDLNSLAVGKGLRHMLDDAFHRELNILYGELSLLRSDQFNQFGLRHEAFPSVVIIPQQITGFQCL
ncbi:hypothetical protein MARHY2253 [Marinobacter nauticus ATCC 49840]|nr:hypothetical protein MARHY2253 [Marinobacter nauticus ATCC 49840]